MKFNILILHSMLDPKGWRESLVEKEFCLPLFAKEHNYCVHEYLMPLPAYVRDINFDAIILTQSFLARRWDSERFLEKIYREYSFIKDSRAFKIALPQDDYLCSAILDRLMVYLKVDIVYPVCVDYWDVLYPLYSAIGGKLRQGYTGYISEKLIEKTAMTKKIWARRLDVAYRAVSLLPSHGRIGLVKAQIGKKFEEKALSSGLLMDISTDPKRIISGSSWYDFIENTKTMIGVNSGSSILDPEGKITSSVYKFIVLNPRATFEDIEAECFPNLDGLYSFTAFSPRNYECALFRTVQLLVPGAYGGFMREWEDYIPLAPDMSNFNEVLNLIKDTRYLETIGSSCRNKILSFHQLRYEQHVSELINQIIRGSRISDSERSDSEPLINRYKEDIKKINRGFWCKERIKKCYRQVFTDIGILRIRYAIKEFFNRKRIRRQ